MRYFFGIMKPPPSKAQESDRFAARSLVLLAAMLLIPLASVHIGSRSARAQASAPLIQPLIAVSQPITAADLIRKIRQDENWIDNVKSFRVRLQDTWTHADNRPAESGTVELGFDEQRLYTHSEMPDDARVSVWDGTRAWGYERDHRLLELGTINGKPVTGNDFYFLQASRRHISGEMLVDLAYFRAGMRHSWWRSGMREGPGEAISFGLPPDFHTIGETTFRGKKCYELRRDLRVDIFYVGIDDQHLYGIQELTWARAKDPREDGIARQFAREVGLSFENLDEAYKWVYSLPDDQKKLMEAKLLDFRRPLARPATLFWYEKYEQLGPGYWFPMLQGYDNWDWEKAKLGDPPESSRTEKVLGISVKQPLPEQWFVQDWKEGVPVQDSSHNPYLTYFYKKHFTSEEWQAILDKANQKAADHQAQADRKESVVGKPAPEFSDVWVQGNPLKLADIKGKVTIVACWDLSNELCRNDVPLLNELAENANGFGIISIHAAGRPVAAVKKAIAEQNIKFPVCLDGPEMDYDGAWGKQFFYQARVIQLPRAIVIDAKGNIAANGSLANMVAVARKLAASPADTKPNAKTAPTTLPAAN